MTNHEELGVKLKNCQLKKFESTAKHKTGTTLRMTNKKIQDEELPHESFLTTRQKTKYYLCFNFQSLNPLIY